MPRLRPAKVKDTEEVAEVVVNDETGEALFESKDAATFVEKSEPPSDKDDGEQDITLSLKKQIEDLQKSENLARERLQAAERERQEALRMAAEREAEAFRSRAEVTDSRVDAVTAAIAAAKAEAEKAEQDIEAAASIGDSKAQAEAYRRLARSEANLAKLEDGLAELNEFKKNPPKQPTQVVSDGLENTNLPETAKEWLRAHPEYLRDQRKNSKIQALHWDILDEGHEPFSKPYFESMEIHLGLREAPKQKTKAPERDDDDDDDDTQTNRGSVVSAPVSREAPGGNQSETNPNRVRLTAAQQEAARLAGITDAEYAKQFITLKKLKAEGHYGESR